LLEDRRFPEEARSLSDRLILQNGKSLIPRNIEKGEIALRGKRDYGLKGNSQFAKMAMP